MKISKTWVIKMPNKFRLGDTVLIIWKKSKKWVIKLEEKVFHCDAGGIKLVKIINESPGAVIKSNKGNEVRVYFPTILDSIRSVKHSSQIIYEKDASTIAMLVNASAGKTIYEAGTGSGALTSVLAQLVMPNGLIVTHDVRKENLETAKKNLFKLGILNVDFNLADVKNGFRKGLADGFVLDLGDPWNVVSNVRKNLVPGGMIVIFVTVYNQLEQCKEKLLENNFTHIKVIETIERVIEVKPNAVRPKTTQIAHTGFIISARFLGG